MKKIKEEYDLLCLVMENLEKRIWVRCIPNLTPLEIETLNPYCFITAKPVTYLINLSEKDYIRKKNKWLPKIVAWIKEHVPGTFMPYSAEFEGRCLIAPRKCEKTGIQLGIEMLKELDGVPSMIPQMIKTGFKSLDLDYFFTAGSDEVKCWTIKKNSKAPQAAGRIHGDFERGFICAEVMAYDDFIASGCSQAKVKDEGKYRQQGKEYKVVDGDIIFFKFNVTAKKK
jgi:obg-like ATPase 1